MILNALFSDHMVLQRDRPIRVFGMGCGHFEVDFCGHHAACDNPMGDFCVELPAMPAGGPYEMTVSLDGEIRVIRDVLIGEVFFAAGQSNMQMTLGQAVPPRDFIPEDARTVDDVGLPAAARVVGGIHDCPTMRYYTVLRPENNEHYGQEWIVSTAEAAPPMSAIGWIFGTKFAERYHIPVGIITLYQGASIMQSFTSRETVVASPHAMTITPQRAGNVMYYPAWGNDGAIYDYMMKRAAPIQARAVLWYQGESNNHPDEAPIFADLMADMMADWRALFRAPDIPFFEVQVAPFASGWPSLGATREAQWDAAQKIPGLYIVTIGDIGEETQIHPSHKEEVADRLLLAVRNVLFGEPDLPYLGPVCRECVFSGGSATVSFDNVNGGLTTDGEIDNFFLLDETGKKYKAACRVDGDRLIATAEGLTRAVGAEFGMENFNTMHLFSGAGLPAVQFKR